MGTIVTVIGVAAAVCTTAANVPQLKKAWTTQETDDLSLRMLVLLAVGLALWVTYGALRADYVVLVANIIGLGLVAALASLKLYHRSSR